MDARLGWIFYAFQAMLAKYSFNDFNYLPYAKTNLDDIFLGEECKFHWRKFRHIHLFSIY